MNVDNITCPAIAILYKNGTLKPDADGFCTYQQLMEAAQTLGLGKVLADGAAGEAKKAPDKKINIFDLGGAAQTDGKSVGFKYTSGMRRPADEERLKEIMGDKEAFTLKDLKALNKQVKRSAERLAAGNSAGPAPCAEARRVRCARRELREVPGRHRKNIQTTKKPLHL